jgi:NADPH:quinone reductase-like Zn-dependent oxidoreductase
MKAMIVARYGAPENFQLSEVPDPAPKTDEVLIRVRAIGVNFADLLQRMGVYPGTPKPPFVPGFEVAGIVERAAASAGTASDAEAGPPLRVGDRVVALTSFNAYAELAATRSSNVFRIPDALPFEDAAALPVVYLTAFHSMFKMGNLERGDRILIHGAAGGVGIAAVQLAKSRGLVIFGSAGPSKQEYLRTIGVDYPIDYTRDDIVETVRRIAPDGIEMVMDPIGGKSWARSVECLGPTGRLVVYGFSAAAGPSGKRSLWRGGRALMQSPKFSLLEMMRKNLTVIGVQLGQLQRRAGLLRGELGEIFQMYAAGEIKPVIGKTFPLAEAAAAHRYIQERQNIGKVVLQVA